MPAMSFLDHLEELRKRLIYSIIAVVAASLSAGDMPRGFTATCSGRSWMRCTATACREKLVYLNPTEPFNLYLKIGFMAGLFVASPLVLYQVWLFISPGLYRNEKTLCDALHVLDGGAVPGGRIFRLQDGLSARRSIS